MIKTGQVLNDTYEIRERIGSGGGGVIYKAYHRRMRKFVAVKLIKDDIRGELQNRAEVDIMKDLKNDYLPQVIDFVEDGNDVYTVMEFVEGQNFKQLINAGKSFSEAQVRKYALQLCEAVEYLHEHVPPIIHSDIKPANIMLTPQDNICLIDFNISIMSDSGIAASRGGSKDFGAPEQFKRVIAVPSETDDFHEKTRFIDEDNTEILMDDKEHISRNSSLMKTKDTSRAFVDVRTDIYGIGASVYYMLTGRIPNGGNLDFRGIRCSEMIKKTISKAMDPVPSKRYENVGELKKALKSKINIKRTIRASAVSAASLLVCVCICGGIMSGFFSDVYNDISDIFKKEDIEQNNDNNSSLMETASIYLVENNYEQATISFVTKPEEETTLTTVTTEITQDSFSGISLVEYEMPVDKAVWTNGSWEKSISYRFDELNPELFKDEIEIRVEFEINGEQKSDKPPVELIFQNSTTDPQILAKISPYKYDVGSASFSHNDINDMLDLYGSDTCFDYIHIGDCGTEIKVTKFVISGITLPIIPDYHGLTADEYVKLLAERKIGYTVIMEEGTDIPDGYVVSIVGKVGDLYNGMHVLNVYQAAPEYPYEEAETKIKKEFITIQGKQYPVNSKKLHLPSMVLTDPLCDSDIEDLDEMTELTYLNFDGNNISSISFVRNMSKLEDLQLENIGLSDISPVSGLKRLSNLELRTNNISDLTPLSGLTELKKLTLSGNNITDIAALSGLRKLEYLNLANNHFCDITPLKDMTDIKWLWLCDTQISDTSPVSGMSNLTYLDISWNNISDITALKNCINITELNICENSVSDISPLSNSKKLSTLILDDNNISNIEPLSGLKNMKTLWLSGNQISDITALSDLTMLEDLDLSQNQISDISPLLNMKNLKSLNLYNNPITEEDIKKLKEALPDCGIVYKRI